MKYFIDTEFIEYPCTIELISIGIAAEDGRTYYAVSSEFNELKASDWVKENVIPHLGVNWLRITNKAIADQIIKFIGNDPSPEFWGYCSDYDWVVFMWLFGPMVNKPTHFPYYCNDIRQLQNQLGVEKIDIPNESHHNALGDALWTKRAYEYLMKGQAK